jgi:hypothetical protein
LLLLSQSELTQSEEPSQQLVLAKCISCSQPITREDELYLCPGPQCGQSKKKMYLHGGEEGGGCEVYFEFKGSLTRLCELCVFNIENTPKK